MISELLMCILRNITNPVTDCLLKLFNRTQFHDFLYKSEVVSGDDVVGNISSCVAVVHGNCPAKGDIVWQHPLWSGSNPWKLSSTTSPLIWKQSLVTVQSQVTLYDWWKYILRRGTCLFQVGVAS